MAKKQENGGCTGVIGSIFGIACLIVALGGCMRGCSNGNNNDSKPKTTQSSKKKPTKAQIKQKKEKDFKIKDSQKAINNGLSSLNLSDYVIKVKYQGDGEAEVTVSDNFKNISASSKTTIAKKINNLITSDAEDSDEASADPYSFLTFVQTNLKLVGRSEYSSHNEYKWFKY